MNINSKAVQLLNKILVSEQGESFDDKFKEWLSLNFECIFQNFQRLYLWK